jgi:hypothetical protein
MTIPLCLLPINSNRNVPKATRTKLQSAQVVPPDRGDNYSKTVPAVPTVIDFDRFNFATDYKYSHPFRISRKQRRTCRQ